MPRRVPPSLVGQSQRAVCERLFASLHNCRRVVTRWERYAGNYLGMVQFAYARILLRAFMR